LCHVHAEAMLSERFLVISARSWSKMLRMGCMLFLNV